ncbi:exopolysaccharide biosynthesis polyprenyl glycosylphosphotransferase [Candidatus Omnitrophota bacterium]
MKVVFKNIKYKKKILMFFIDVCCIVFSCLLSYVLVLRLKNYNATEWILSSRCLMFTLSIVFIYSLISYISGLYEISVRLRRVYTLTSLIVIGSLCCIIFLLVGRIFDLYLHTKYILLLFLVIVTASIFINRMFFYRYIILPKKRTNNVLFIGTDHLTEHILNEMDGFKYNVLGVLSNEHSTIGQHKDGLKVVSTGKNLGTLIRSKRIKTLVPGLNNHIPLDVIKKIYKYEFKGVEVYRSDYFYEILTRKFALQQYLCNKNIPFPNIDTFTRPIFKNTKKLIDSFGALAGLIVVSPLLLIISILIKLISKGPVFYLQERVGFQEKPFKLIKFRTMVTDAEKENGPQWAIKNDSRVTKIGKFLRKTRLDELPQLINVIKGEISFVGPRPIRRHFAQLIEENTPFYSIRFSIKPGLTGWAQVNYDYGGTIEGHIKKFQYDLYYLKHASLFLDLFIMIKTLQTLVRRPAH